VANPSGFLRLLTGSIFTSFVIIFFGCEPRWIEPQRIDTWNGVQNAYVCLDLPTTVASEAIEAVKLWDKSLKQWKRMIPVVGGTNITDEFELGCSYLITEVNRSNPGDPLAVAWASRIGGRYVYLRKGYYEEDVKVIVLHELGHALGAQHVAGTLMNPTYNTITQKCPDVTTVSQVAAFNGLDLSTLSWCED
jgi:hypothetical protein